MRWPGSSPARRVEVTEVLDNLATPDYASAFEASITATDARSPEQWVRAIFEDAPRGLRWFVVAGWYGLGFRLGPRPSASHVLGWTIAISTPDAITLEVHSPLVTAHKVLRIDQAHVVMTTFVRYERRPARIIWSTVAPIHHRTEPYLLGHAASRPDL